MPLLFADVEYHGLIYGDAELREGVWYFRNGEGASPFFEQERVNAVTTPLEDRRHAGSELSSPITVVPLAHNSDSEL